MGLPSAYEAVAAGSEAVEQLVWFGGGLLVLGLLALVLSRRSHRAGKRRNGPTDRGPR